MAESQTNNVVTEDERQKADAYFKGDFEILKPPLKRAAYSDRTAFVMASMAQLAYDRYELGGKAKELFESKLKSGGFTLVAIFNSDETDTQAFLAKNDEFAVLSFRGTEVTKKQDVVTDAKAAKVSVIEGGVHRGFLDAYNSIRKDIMDTLPQVLGMPLYITGHSLGAALATVSTKMLENEQVGTTKAYLRDYIAACYTFGSPRVGNQGFDEKFKSAVYRVVNTTDIVTVVPLLAMGYTHVGDVRFLGRGEGDIRRGVPILRRTLFFIAAIFRLFGPLVGDHAIDLYRRKLAAISHIRNSEDLGGSGRSGGRF